MAMLLPSCGCIQDDDEGAGERFRDGILPPSPGLNLTREYGYQTGVGMWSANYTVIHAWPKHHYSLSGLGFQGVDRHGNQLDAERIRYVEWDGDGYISQGEHVLITDMPESFNGQDVNITINGSRVGVITFGWDTTKPVNYLVKMGITNSKKTGEGTWAADLRVDVWPGTWPVACTNLSFGFVSSKGVVLQAASARYIDKNDDGLVSVGDVIGLDGLTESYGDGTFQVLVGDALVGMMQLPQISRLG